MLAPKIATFSIQSKFGIEKSDQKSNLVPYHEQKYLSVSAFLVIYTSKQAIKATFKSCDQVSIS